MILIQMEKKSFDRKYKITKFNAFLKPNFVSAV